MQPKGPGILGAVSTRPLRLTAALEGPTEHDYNQDRPASDEVFESYRNLYAYDHANLEARTESVDDTSMWWRRERVTFAAAYGDERVIAYVLLPRRGSPPRPRPERRAPHATPWGPIRRSR